MRTTTTVSAQAVPLSPPAREYAARLVAALTDPERLAAVHGTGLLAEAHAVPTLERAARLAARALGAPFAQVNLVTDASQAPVAAFAEAPHPVAPWCAPVSLAYSYCQHVVATGAPLAVDDARAHPLVRDSAATAESGIVGYLSVPLRAPGPNADGPVVGSVCVVDRVPRRWTPADVETLADVAAAAAHEVALRLEARAAVAAAERQTARLLAAAGEGVLGVDAAGRTTFANPAAERMLGWTAAEMAGRDQHALVHHTRADGAPCRAADCPMRAAPAAGRAGRVDGEVFWRRDGSAFPVEYTVTPVFEAGRPAGAVLTFQDVSRRRDAEAAERRALADAEHARADAERANAAKSQFLAVMSHELRTPLNAIGGYAELLEMGLRGPVTDAQRTDLARIKRSQQHLLGLINDILNYAKLEAGHAHFAPEDVALDAAADDVVALVLPQLRAKGLTLARDAGWPPGIAARADREKLRQVLVNLLTNAVKFTDAPGTIALGAERAGPAVRVRVRDTGIGIPADRLDHVFDPFVQVDPRLARTREGTGLGLAISRDLARAMGGDLTAESEVGVGSTFTLTLPAADAAAAADDAGAQAGRAADAVARCAALVAAGDVHGALAHLNARTGYRFTGLYRVDGAVLRNVWLVDRDDPAVRVGPDAPLADVYCAVVGETGRPFTVADAAADERLAGHPARGRVASYCGALVRDAAGGAAGTLCHFDLRPLPVPADEVAVLEAAAPLLARAVAGA
jgi:PAS domain S-box-containing protein